MHLPVSAWKKTLQKLGLRLVEPRRPIAHRQTRSAQFETLERREVLTANISYIDLTNDTGVSSSDNITTDPELTITVGGDFYYGSAQVEFDHDGDAVGDAEVPFYYPDETQYYNPATTDPSLLTYIGEVSLHYRVVEFDDQQQVVGASSWQLFEFTLAAPPEPEIEVLDESELDIADGVGLVTFQQTIVGSPVTRTLTIKNTGEAELTIDSYSIQLPSGYSIVQYPDETVYPSGQTTLVVQLDAYEEGAYFGELSLGNNDTDESLFSFDLSGQVIDTEPEIKVQLVSGANIPIQNYLDWGQTGVGVPVDLTLTIINQGSGELEIDTPNIVLSSGFSVVTGCDTIVAPNGGQTTLTIRLDADQAGSYLGFLTIPNNDTDEGTFSLAISGLVGDDSYAEQEITFSGVDLVNDTGISDSDWSTYDPRLTGVVGGDFGSGSVRVQFDHNDDGLIDGDLVIPSAGTTFQYDPAAVDPTFDGFVGPVPLRYRAVLLDQYEDPVSVSVWFELPLDLEPVGAAGNLTIAEINLVADTGTSNTDKVTVRPAIYVVVAGDLEGGSARVEFDHTGNGTIEGSIVVTSNAVEFAYDPRAIDPQYATAIDDYALAYRLVKLDAAGQVVATGGWDAFHFSTESLPDSQWTVSSFGLQNDTGPNTTDQQTTDPTLKGRAVGPGAPTSNPLGLPLAHVEFDLTGDESPDVSLPTDALGDFTFVPPVSSYGPRTISVRVKEWNASYQSYLEGV